MMARGVAGVLAAALAASVGAYGMHVFDARGLAAEAAGRAADAQRHEAELLAVSQAALDAEQRANAAHQAAASRVAVADAQFTKERTNHEIDNRRYRLALADGTDRLRVAVRDRVAAGADDVPGTACAASMDDGAAAVADLDPATAQRVFAVAGDDQREIDKLKALQAYVCAIRAATPGCEDGGRSTP